METIFTIRPNPGPTGLFGRGFKISIGDGKTYPARDLQEVVYALEHYFGKAVPGYSTEPFDRQKHFQHAEECDCCPLCRVMKEERDKHKPHKTLSKREAILQIKDRPLKAYEVLFLMGIERCPECHCAVGGDWEFKDFSNKTIAVCPQCKTEINTEEKE